MEVPWTLMLTGASGDAAGPLTTEPSEMLNVLPWHGQLMVPPVTVPTMQPWWVHTAVNASNDPAFGWVMTIFLSARILPPPTGISAVLASTGGPLRAGPPELAGPAGGELLWAGGAPATPPLLESYRVQPASTAAQAAPAQASRVRRLDAGTLGSAMTGLLSA